LKRRRQRNRTMATEIRVPTLGESVSEATIGKWFKKVGDSIAADEPLVELETDKVTIEVPAPAAGTLSEITANEGDSAEPGARLGRTGGAGAAAYAPAAAPQAEAPKAEAAKAAAPAAAAAATSMPAAPSAAKAAAEAGISTDQIAGSGKRGQVLKGDV